MRVSPLRESLILLAGFVTLAAGFFVLFQLRSQTAQLVGVVAMFLVVHLLGTAFRRRYTKRS